MLCREVRELDKSGVVTIEGEATELKPVAPFEGTPPLGLADQSGDSAPFEPPLPIVECDTAT